MSHVEIPYVRLTEAQKPTAYSILLNGATLLKKWSALYHPKKFRQFRNDVMKGDKNPQNVIPSDRLDEFHADVSHIMAIRQPNKDLGGRSVEQAVLENFAALAKKHARQWSSEGDPNGVSRADYLQEAYMTIVEAMYQYTREDIDLSTFVWQSLRNRMINVTNQSNLFCPLTNADLDLVVRYDRAKQNLGGTFDEIVESLGLSSEEGRHLGSILTKVFSENQLGSQEDRGGVDSPSNDYTGHRVGIDSEKAKMVRVKQSSELDEDGESIINEVVDVEGQEHVNHILDNANLSALERKVMEAAMDPFYGWQTEFAKTHINPDTKKPYSRMRITQVLETARAKVAKVLNLEAA